MKSTKTNTRHTPVITPARRIGCSELAILDEFSAEQLQMIRRLSSAIGARDVETVYELASAALYVLGLDPVAWDSLNRLSTIVLGAGAGSDIANGITETREAAEEWTKAQRAVERAAAIKGRAA